MTNRTPQRLGSISNVMLSSFESVSGEGGPGSSLFGIPYQDSWIVGILRDEQGEFYWPMRSNRSREPHEARVAVFSSDVQDLQYMAVQRVFANIDITADSERGIRFVNTTDAPGEAWYTDKACAWKQEGMLELKGKSIGPGMQAVFPTKRRAGEGALQVYCNLQYMVEGHFRGRPVKGFMLLERNFDTITWLESTWAGGTGGYMYFGNVFDDGSVEMGFVYVGGELNGAIIYNEKGEDVINTANVDLAPTITEAGVLTDALYSFDDSAQWQFIMDPPGKAGVKRSLVPGAISTISLGYMTRVGETRKRVRGWAMANVGRTY